MKLKYISHHFSTPFEYTLIQHQKDECIYVYAGSKLIGSIEKFGLKWVQINGRDLGDKTINELGGFLDKIISNG